MKNRLFPNLIFLVMLMLHWGCESEMESIGISETPEALDPEIIALKNNLHSNYGSDPFPYYHNLEDMGPKTGKSDVDKVELDLEILWDEHTMRTEDGDEAHEFRAVEKALPVVGTELIDTFTYTLMALVKDGETVYYLMKFSHMKGSNLQATFNKPAGFSGTVQVHDMAGDLASILYLDDGEIVSQITTDEFGNAKTARSNCDAMRGGSLEMNSIYDFENPTCNLGGGGRNERVRVDSYTDWYNYRGNGDWDYSHSTYNGTTYEWVWVPNGGYHPGYIDRYVPKDYTGDTGPNYDPADFYSWFYEQRQQTEDRIVKNTNNPCVDKIIDRLKQKDLSNLYVVPNIGELSGTGHLSQGIFDLFDKSGFYSLAIEIDEAGYSNGIPKNAHTIKTSGKLEWTITLDDDYVRNATQLAIARTIIHESIHAFLGYTLNVNSNSELSVSMREYYNNLGAQQTLSSGVKVNLTEHEFIGQYVQALAKSLSIWDNRKQSQSYYEKMAWGGLETSSAFNALDSNLKNSIRTVLSNEQTANSQAKGEKCP